MQITVGENSFKTKKEAKEFYRSILCKYKDDLNKPLSDSDFKEMYELLKLHPNSSQKLADEIEYIYVDKNEGGTRSFYIRYKNGKRDDSSFHKIIDKLK